MIVLPTIWMPKTSLGPLCGTPALANSSATITVSMGDRPPPPYSFGHATARAHERAVGAEPHRDDAGAPGEDDSGAAVELLLGGTKERLAETKGDGAAGDGEPEVEEVGHGCHGEADEAARARHDVGAGLT